MKNRDKQGSVFDTFWYFPALLLNLILWSATDVFFNVRASCNRNHVLSGGVAPLQSQQTDSEELVYHFLHSFNLRNTLVKRQSDSDSLGIKIKGRKPDTIYVFT